MRRVVSLYFYVRSLLCKLTLWRRGLSSQYILVNNKMSFSFQNFSLRTIQRLGLLVVLLNSAALNINCYLAQSGNKYQITTRLKLFLRCFYMARNFDKMTTNSNQGFFIMFSKAKWTNFLDLFWRTS